MISHASDRLYMTLEACLEILWYLFRCDSISSNRAWLSVSRCFVKIEAIQAIKAWIHLVIENINEEVNEVIEVMENVKIKRIEVIEVIENCQDWED